MGQYNCFYEFKPLTSSVNHFSTTRVRKIREINVQGKCKIDLSYQQGRRDTNIQLPARAVSLSQVIIKDWNNTVVKKYNLEYDYSFVIDNRMILKKVNELNSDNATNNSHELYYEFNDRGNNNISKDYWGYFNLVPAGLSVDINFSNEPTPRFSTTDILQKIK
jgi:hypothetical protein